MERSLLRYMDEMIFRPFLPWFLVRSGLLLISGAIFLGLGVEQSDLRWWLGAVLTVMLATAHALRYTTQAVILRGDELVFREGLLGRREISIPILQVDVEMRQDVLGRLFDYGAVFYQNGERTIGLPNIAQLRLLRWVITQRRREMQPLWVAQLDGRSGWHGSYARTDRSAYRMIEPDDH